MKDYWFKTSDGSNAMEYLMYSDHDYVQTQIDPTFLFSAQNHKDITGYKFYFSPMDACLMTDDKYFIGNNKQFATGEFVSQVPSQNFYIDYQANDQAMNIIYKDAAGNVIKTDKVTGKTDQTVDTKSTLPSGWKIADSSAVKTVPTQITFKGAKTADVTITVDHAHKTITPDKPVQPGEKTPSGKVINGANTEDLHKTVTRTITINDPHTGTSQRVQKVELTRSADVDKVTGNVTYGAWSTDQWDAVKVPTVAGYTTNQPSIPQVTIDGDTKDQKVVINYTANNGTQTINYVDAKGNKIGSQVINGKTDQKIKVTPQVPAGWVLTQDSGMPTDVTIKPSDTPINVKIEHGIKDVQPTNPVKPDEKTPDGKKIIKGAHEDDLTKTINQQAT